MLRIDENWSNIIAIAEAFLEKQTLSFDQVVMSLKKIR